MLHNNVAFKSKKSKLSNTLLNLKFMLKTKERLDNDHVKNSAEIDEKEVYNDKRITDFETVTYSECCELIDGRLSFGGMNREIELLMGTSNTTVHNTEVNNPVIKLEMDNIDNESVEQFRKSKKIKRHDKKRKNK